MPGGVLPNHRAVVGRVDKNRRNEVVYNRSRLRFHALHGRNVRLTGTRFGAFRPEPTQEFNDAVVISERPLYDDEMFELRIDQMTDRWSGSIEAGRLV